MFHDQKNLLHGGSGGFDGDSTSRGHGNRGDVQTENDGFIGRPSIGNEIVPAKHANVITGSIPVIVLGIGRTGIDAGGIGGEGEISIGKISEFGVNSSYTFLV